MQDLRIILIILGAVAIAALLIHGLWTSQKGRQKPMRDKPLSKVENQAPEDTDDEFDRDGIGRVRVAGHHQAASLSQDHEIDDDWQISPHFSAMSDDDTDEPSLVMPPTLSASVFAEDPNDEHHQAPGFVSQPAKRAASPNESAAELRARQYRQGEIDPLFDDHEQDSPNLDSHTLDNSKLDNSKFDNHELDDKNHAHQATEPQAATVQPTAPIAKPEPEVKREPIYSEELVEPAPAVEPAVEPVVDKPVAPITKTWQDVYVVNLMAKPNQTIAGIDLIRAVTQVGLVFGDMDIFHRYQGSSTQGEALFSLANMVKPGTFTPEAMRDFTTPGVSIFMQLPKPGMAKNHFNMMIQAADNMAEELDAVLLDGQRHPLALEYLVRCRTQLSDYDSQAQ
ncbi:cell division protein ZipA [Oceanisphaera profunda]|uniref:Cell division protein ZipA n=1 Tax=Oceanisphaera profunda TaxID=1416627 RepID=A0A1Y0D7N5_9GAMM|nr:cell division protein ZipA [Oceanisphaera profunda]ART83156.1 cell division protein ZipA [Oceanisphaera profunda]